MKTFKFSLCCRFRRVHLGAFLCSTFTNTRHPVVSRLAGVNVSRYQFSTTSMSGSEAAPMSDKPTVPIIDVPTELDGFGQPRIPFRGHYEMEKNDLRRKWAEQFAGGKSLEFVSDWWNVEGKEHTVDSQMTLLKGNIENPIGLAKIPLGLVGPVLMHGKHVDGYAKFYVVFLNYIHVVCCSLVSDRNLVQPLQGIGIVRWGPRGVVRVYMQL